MLRQEVHHLVDTLPEARLAELVRWLRSQRIERATAASQPAESSPPRYTPVRLAGLWEGVIIGDDDLREVRQTMWAGFGESPA